MLNTHLLRNSKTMKEFRKCKIEAEIEERCLNNWVVELAIDKPNKYHVMERLCWFKWEKGHHFTISFLWKHLQSFHNAQILPTQDSRLAPIDLIKTLIFNFLKEFYKLPLNIPISLSSSRFFFNLKFITFFNNLV